MVLRAERDRRYRRRRRDRLMTVLLEVDDIGLDWLVRAPRTLDPRDLDGDRVKVRAAVGRAVTAMIRISSRS
jgi:hypothetical protein